jgi:TRAP-type C4-dicarboxylate transport system permease small subunit
MTHFANQARRLCEGVMVVMMAILFTSFIAQVVFRYVLNVPLGWSDEISNFFWLWGILWGASFVMRNHEDIRFDMLYNLMPRKVKRGLVMVASMLLVTLLALSLPKTWSYIKFMHVEKSPAMGIPMSWVFGLYLVFVVSMCVRHLGIAFGAWQDRLPEDGHSVLDEALQHSKDCA